MKASHLVAISALAVGTMLCQPAASTATTAEKAHQRTKAVTSQVSVAGASASTDNAHTNGSKPKLGPEYKKIDSFVEFRKKLITDGWTPVANPNCHDAVLGDDYSDFCNEFPGKISCRACDIAPEIFRYTSDGYMSVHYIKDGVPLNVMAYGDLTALDHPDKPDIYQLIVTGWRYDASINVIIVD
jgi:hypothetical protein